MQFADLSENQVSVDLATYRAAGYSMLAHKATEGVTFTDSYFMLRWRAAGQLGMTRIAYHMLRGTPPVSQADSFLNLLNDVGYNPDDIFALDFEMRDATRDGAIQWVNEVRAHAPKQRILIYAGDWFLRPSGLRASDLPGPIGFWLSAYVPQAQMPWYVTPGWPAPAAWQYTDKANVPGLGRVDCSQLLTDLQSLYPGGNSNRFSGFRTLIAPMSDPITGPLPNVPYAPVDYPVHALQYSFNTLYGTNLTWDGVYGLQTVTATQNFQRNHGLLPDGVVGLNTWAALDAAATARGL